MVWANFSNGFWELATNELEKGSSKSILNIYLSIEDTKDLFEWHHSSPFQIDHPSIGYWKVATESRSELTELTQFSFKMKWKFILNINKCGTWQCSMLGIQCSVLSAIILLFMEQESPKKRRKKTHRKSGEWNLLIFKVKLKFSTHKHDRYANIQFNIWIFMMDAFLNQASKLFHTISILEFPMEDSFSLWSGDKS